MGGGVLRRREQLPRPPPAGRRGRPGPPSRGPGPGRTADGSRPAVGFAETWSSWANERYLFTTPAAHRWRCSQHGAAQHLIDTSARPVCEPDLTNISCLTQRLLGRWLVLSPALARALAGRHSEPQRGDSPLARCRQPGVQRQPVQGDATSTSTSTSASASASARSDVAAMIVVESDGVACRRREHLVGLGLGLGLGLG